MSLSTNRSGWMSIPLLPLLCVLAMPAPAAAQEGSAGDPAQWVMPNANYAGWNYSALDQINVDNVEQLTMAWTMQLGVHDSYEASPLVIGDTMYIVTPEPNYVYALDLARDGFIEWEFRPEIEDPETTRRSACCGAQTRGLGYSDGRLYFVTLDGQVYALDAETGEQIWQAENANIGIGETVPGMPLVVGDKVIVGVAGGERGVRGHVTAYNLDDGRFRWRYYSMGPNNEVGIGSRFAPFYPDDRVPNPALDTWSGDSWRRGGGAVWGWFTYDAELNLFYYGTSNCGPWNPDYRREWGVVELDEDGGLTGYRNNYCASILARDVDSGELVWAYNMTPQDQWDLDEPNVNLLIDLEINGETRKTLVRPARNGYFYVFRSRDGTDAPRALDVRLQRHLRRHQHGDRPAALRHDEDDVHRHRGSAAVPAGRRERRHRLVSRHRRPELAERRVLPAHRTRVHPDLELLRSVEDGRRRVRARERLHAA